jgi:hypothetical protein
MNLDRLPICYAEVSNAIRRFEPTFWRPAGESCPISINETLSNGWIGLDLRDGTVALPPISQNWTPGLDATVQHSICVFLFWFVGSDSAGTQFHTHPVFGP